MQITVEIPDEIAQRLDQTRGSLSRRLLEVIIADAYTKWYYFLLDEEELRSDLENA